MQSHAKAQRRKGKTQEKEALNLFAVFFAALRLCVKFPFVINIGA
jgi:hypothetical protein